MLPVIPVLEPLSPNVLKLHVHQVTSNHFYPLLPVYPIALLNNFIIMTHKHVKAVERAVPSVLLLMFVLYVMLIDIFSQELAILIVLQTTMNPLAGQKNVNPVMQDVNNAQLVTTQLAQNVTLDLYSKIQLV